jgi:PHP family Zn ribbon phosphoesterase
MNVYPFDEVADRVAEILEGTSTDSHYLALKQLAGGSPRVEIYQQFICAQCLTKQTMPDPNVLYTHGKCEECGAVTNIRERGCNYAVHYHGRS